MSVVSDYIPRRLTWLDDKGAPVTASEEALWKLPPPLVILGDPGMGKSAFLEERGKCAGCHTLDAAKFLRLSPKRLPSGILLLDALDEVKATNEGDALDRVLTKLGEAGYPDFVLSCRAADWQSSANARAITSDYGRRVRVASLEPLTAEESLSRLETKLGPARAQEFDDALDRHALSDLLQNPQSLNMLIEISDGGIPTSRTDLFERAVHKMVAEHNAAHVQSELNKLDPAQLLDGAGAAMAMILLGGKEGLHTGLQVTTPDELEHIARISALPLAGHCATALKSRLFRARATPDSFGVCHRTVAEYLGARWLGRVVDESSDPDCMVKRLLALIQVGGHVPASLRGLHAWLAQASHHFSKPVIAADPYGALRYGDFGTASMATARHVWESFEKHGSDDPWFRANDWRTFSVAALAQKGLGTQLARLLEDQRSPFHLRSLILELVQGADCVPEMGETLLAIVRSESRTYSERHDAIMALSGWPQSGVDWRTLFLDMSRAGDPDVGRLADETIAAVGVEKFSDDDIAEIVIARCNPAARARRRQKRERAIDFWALAEFALPDDRCAGLLDALVTLFTSSPDKRPPEHDDSLGNLVWALIARQTADVAVDPVRYWRWLDTFAEVSPRNTALHSEVESRLRANPALRQAVQAHIFLTDEGAASRERDDWNLALRSSALLLREEDILMLMERLVQDHDREGFARKTFKLLVLASGQMGWLSNAFLSAAERWAGDDASLRSVLRSATATPPIKDKGAAPELRALNDARKSREVRYRDDRMAVLAQLEETRAGRGLSGILALGFLGYAYGPGREVAPENRISDWIGADLHDVAVDVFEAALHRPLGASLHEISARITLRESDDDPVWTVVAGLAQRHLSGRGFADIGEEHLLAGLIVKRRCLSVVDKYLENFGEALEAFAAEEEERFERYLRAQIEPQMARGDDHISGAHHLVARKRHRRLRLKLLLEWFDTLSASRLDLPVFVDALLDAPADMQETAEHKIDALIAHPPRFWNDEHQSAYWIALRIVRDFDESRPLLEAAAEDPAFLWALAKAVGYDRYNERKIRALPLERLAWIFERFEARWRDASHPEGPTSGTRNPWDAAQFLTALLFHIANETDPAALRLLHNLTERGSATYGATLRAARARQRQKASETDYTPPPLGAVAAALREQKPETAAEIRAIVMNAIGKLSARIGHASTETVDLFHDGPQPKDEDKCRNALLDLLGPVLPFGIVWAPEERMPKGKRADAGFRLGMMRVPLEVKLAWNRELWTAATDQLDRRYASADHMADGQGIYLVFWFGPDGKFGKRIRPSPQGEAPCSAAELEEMLKKQLFAGATDRLSIMVLDVAR